MELEKVSLKEFFSEHREDIRNVLNNSVNTLFLGDVSPEKYATSIDHLAGLLKQPYPRQARVAIAGYEYLKKNNALIYSAMMGTGKTLISLCLAFLQAVRVSKNLNYAIVCPTHLVDKWIKEIESTIPQWLDYEICLIKSGVEFLSFARDRNRKRVRFYVFSKEVCKLSYTRDEPSRSVLFARNISSFEKEYVCPHCGNVYSEYEVQRFSEFSAFLKGLGNGEKKKLELYCRKCTIQSNAFVSSSFKEFCGFHSGQRQKPSLNDRKISVSEAIRSIGNKGLFDLLLIDEAHEFSNKDTLQGKAMSLLVRHSKKVVGLTGTILNGYVSSLYHLLFTFFPKKMISMGYGYGQEKKFSSVFGGFDKKVELTASECRKINKDGFFLEDGGVSKLGGEKRVAPIINPSLLRFLISNTIFMGLEDLNISLPKYSESVCFVTPECNPSYIEYIGALANEMADKESLFAKKFVGAFVNHSLAILDLPFLKFESKAEIVIDECEMTKEFVYEPYFKEDYITNKEHRLFELLLDELKQGRKCLVYVHFSSESIKRVVGVLQRLFSERKMGYISVEGMSSSVSAQKRETWLKAKNADVLVTNPELVKTGLDLYQYPTIIYHQFGYNIQTIKQSSRRAWRLGQTQECKTIFLCYAKSSQSIALNLVARKIKASNDVEGKVLVSSNDISFLASGEEWDIRNAIAQSMLSKKDKDKQEDISFGDLNFSVKKMGVFEEYCKERFQNKPKKTEGELKTTARYAPIRVGGACGSLFSFCDSSITNIRHRKKKNETKQAQVDNSPTLFDFGS